MSISSIALPAIIGHRGASGYRPEHTMSAYELAIALGADALEPDLVATKDGVIVIRHENEISGTTDVADHPEFASRRETKVVDGTSLDGWFTEDFTWDELQTLRARERIPKIRASSASFDDRFPFVSLGELLSLADASETIDGNPLGLVLEIKHAAYFASIGLPLDELIRSELATAGWDHPGKPLTFESFEPRVLDAIGDAAMPGNRVFLLEAKGRPADAQPGDRDYSEHLTNAGLTELADRFDGISVDKALIIPPNAAGVALEASDLVDRAHDAGLEAYTWTLRPENKFLSKNFRTGGGSSALGNWLAEFQLVMRTGIDGVFADQPDLAREARDSL